MISISNLQVTILVKDMDVSVSFYQTIGFRLEQRWENHYALLEAGGIKIGLHPSAPEQLDKGSGHLSIGLTTDDFEGVEKELQALQIKFEKREEEGGRFIHFNDPDGAALYFIKPQW